MDKKGARGWNGGGVRGVFYIQFIAEGGRVN